MDFLSGLAKGDKSKPTSDEPTQTSDLFSNAKLVAEAAQAHFSDQPEKYDKAKTATAAAEILDVAEKYGRLDETKGVGKYVEQAEDYLRQYKPSGQAATHAPAGDSAGEKTAATGDAVTTTETEKPLNKPEPEGEKSEHSSGPEGGYGNLMKMAGGFLGK